VWGVWGVWEEENLKPIPYSLFPIPYSLFTFYTAIIGTIDRFFVKGFMGMNGTFKMIFTRIKDTPIAWDLMQSFELNPFLL
jgi:hypothetical protein